MRNSANVASRNTSGKCPLLAQSGHRSLHRTCPLAAVAQQTAMPVVGFLHLTSPEPNRENLTAFRRGLAETGYIEQKNVAIEYRWALNKNDRLPALATELVRRQ